MKQGWECLPQNKHTSSNVTGLVVVIETCSIIIHEPLWIVRCEYDKANSITVTAQYRQHPGHPRLDDIPA